MSEIHYLFTTGYNSNHIIERLCHIHLWLVPPSLPSPGAEVDGLGFETHARLRDTRLLAVVVPGKTEHIASSVFCWSYISFFVVF